ncbi:hypothetical protein BDV59DRAFT_199515 [Aspergillus ambiguus]|uniref:uncharacterized protein n=1 Tax=Aspergillus ambiguus TaxID=176160 RepID=UPI003CCD3540
MSLRPSMLTRGFPHPTSLTRQLLQTPMLRSTRLPQPSNSFILRRPFSRASTSHPHPAQPWRLHSAQNPFRGAQTRFFQTSGPRRAAAQPTSLSARLKMLSREYGWSALGVYLLLSAMDFPFCFAAVHFLGADRIGHYEQIVVDSFKAAAGTVFPGMQEQQALEAAAASGQVQEAAEAAAEEQQKKKNKAGEEASLWTQLVLAYAIHKSLIVFRVPLTAAITPKVVKTLRHWGWDLVKGKPRGM